MPTLIAPSFNPAHVRLIGSGSTFTTPEALSRIKAGAPFMNNSRVDALVVNRDFFNKLPENVQSALDGEELISSTFVAKTYNRNLGDRISFSNRGYSVTVIIGQEFRTCRAIGSHLTPDNFSLTLENKGRDAIVELANPVALELTAPGSYGKANESTLHLPVVSISNGEPSVERYNNLGKGKAVGLVARDNGFGVGYWDGVFIQDLSGHFGGLEEVENANTGEVIRSLSDLRTSELLALLKQNVSGITSYGQVILVELARRFENQ